MIVNRAMIDYCTLTSFQPVWFNQVVKDYEGVGRTKAVKINGYDGGIVDTGHGSVFMGEGTQRWGKGGVFTKHFMVKWSGEIADGSHGYHGEGVKCKRLDVQVTLREPKRNVPELLDASLRFGPKFKMGRGRKAMPDFRNSNSQTLYLGSRTGDEFWRLYQKQDSSNAWYLRWEWELKRRRAEWAMSCLSSGETAGNVFRGLMEGYNPEYDWVVKKFVDAADGTMPPEYAREKNRDTMTWLESLTPTVDRLLRNHQTRYRAISLMESWYDLAVNIESDNLVFDVE